jgi:hypothetical protein
VQVKLGTKFSDKMIVCEDMVFGYRRKIADGVEQGRVVVIMESWKVLSDEEGRTIRDKPQTSDRARNLGSLASHLS